jgi:hypothetical protein
MEKITKKELQDQIDLCKLKHQLEVDILEVIAEMCTYKNVNKRFTDKLKEAGIYARISKDNYKHTIYFWRGHANIEINNWDKELTWDFIKSKLHRECEAGIYYQNRLDNHQSDLEKLAVILSCLKENELVNSCFSTYAIISDIEHVIKCSLR